MNITTKKITQKPESAQQSNFNKGKSLPTKSDSIVKNDPLIFSGLIGLVPIEIQEIADLASRISNPENDFLTSENNQEFEQGELLILFNKFLQHCYGVEDRIAAQKTFNIVVGKSRLDFANFGFVFRSYISNDNKLPFSLVDLVEFRLMVKAHSFSDEQGFAFKDEAKLLLLIKKNYPSFLVTGKNLDLGSDFEKSLKQIKKKYSNFSKSLEGFRIFSFADFLKAKLGDQQAIQKVNDFCSEMKKNLKAEEQKECTISEPEQRLDYPGIKKRVDRKLSLFEAMSLHKK